MAATGTLSPNKLERTLSPAPATMTTIGDVVSSYKKTSFVVKEPEYGFGTGSRPPLSEPTPGPGPGAYPIKTTMGKILDSKYRTPSQFSIRGRTKFGDPNARAISKTAASEPGPGQYDLQGKFLSGEHPRESSFPKALQPRDKAGLAPGPGAYEPAQSMGHQQLSTKPDAPLPLFPKADRPTLIPPGSTTIGPGQYGLFPGACEGQVDSRKISCPLVRFGTGYKKSATGAKPDLSDPAPGPGSYVLPGGVASRAKGTPYRNAPAATISGRNKFGSPW